MANWYVSSTGYTAVTQWAATTAYSLGAIRRQLAAPATNLERCFRVTTAGTSGGTEPTWNTGSSATTTDGGVTWTECTGQEAHQRDNGVSTTWTAPAARHNCLTSASNGKNVVAAGDTVFYSSDHAETQSTNLALVTLGTVASPNRYISVSKAGSVPPVSADLTSGASIAATGSATFTVGSTGTENYFNGVTFDASGSTGQLTVGSNDNRFQHFYDGCTLKTPNTSGTISFVEGRAYWKNVTLSLTSAGGLIEIFSNPGTLTWRGGSTSGSGTSCFVMGNTPALFVEGVDFGTISGTLVQPGGSAAFGNVRFYGCKLNASVTLVANQGDGSNLTNNTSGAAQYWLGYDANVQYGEFIDCSSGNDAYHHYWFKWAGYVQTETTIVRTGGATDGTQAASRKIVTNSNASKLLPLQHDLFVYNGVTGAAKTATVEIISSGTLNNDDIWMEVAYLGESGSGKLDFADSYVADPLATHAAVTSSSASWASSPPTPQKQKLQVSFTAQKAGLIRCRIFVAKQTTVYVDHVVTVS